jgi:hypothetical protein
MRVHLLVAAAIAMLGTQADPVLAGGGARPQAHGAPMRQPQVHQQWQHNQPSREVVSHDARTAQGNAHTRFGGPRLEQRSDPNNQNLYRPMYSLDATNPGEPHPYFQTRKDGFGYPSSRGAAVYLGNGQYVIPR